MADAVPGTGEHRAAVETSGARTEALMAELVKEAARYGKLVTEDEEYTRRNQTIDSSQAHVDRVPRLNQAFDSAKKLFPQLLSDVDRVMKQANRDHAGQPSALTHNNVGQARRRLKDGTVSISGDIDWSKVRDLAAQDSRTGRLDQSDPEAVSVWLKKQMTLPTVEAIAPALQLVSSS